MVFRVDLFFPRAYLCAALLVGCSTRETPAPVVSTVSAGSSANTADSTAPLPVILPADLALDTALVGADTAIVKAVHSAANEVDAARESAAAWGKLAMVLSAHEMNGIAARCFARAGELDPDDARWPYLQGDALSSIRPDAAIVAFERAVAINQDVIDNPRLRIAELLIELGRVNEARRYIDKTLSIHQESDRAWLLMARADFLDGNWQSCLDQLARFHGPPTKKSLILAAESNKRLGNHAAADQLRFQADATVEFGWADPFLDEVTTYCTGLKVALVRADKLFGDGKFADSIRILAETIHEYPDSDWARVLLGRSLIRVGRNQEAESELRVALDLAPSSVEAQFRLGVSLYRQERFDEAMVQFQNATKFKPDFTMAYFNLSFCHEAKHDLIGAVRSMRRCVQSEPEYAQGWHRLALLEEKNGDIERSRKAYQRALVLDPDNRTVQDQIRLLDADRSVDFSDLNF